MRPINETAEDRVREWKVIQQFLPVYRYAEARPTDTLTFYDFSLFKGGHRQGIAEVKCRNRRYPTMILAKHKFDELRVAANYPDPMIEFLKVYLIFGFDDGTAFFLQVRGHTGDGWKVAEAGRTDRNQTGDLELCYHIPFEALEQFV